MSEIIKPTILFKRPETIDGIVEFPLPDGTTAKLACKFTYRTKKEFGKLWDELSKGSQDGDAKSTEHTDSAKEAPLSFESIFNRGNATMAKSTLRYLQDWPSELPPLTAESLEQLFDEAPAANNAFWNAYRSLCTTGVVGN